VSNVYGGSLGTCARRFTPSQKLKCLSISSPESALRKLNVLTLGPCDFYGISVLHPRGLVGF